MRGREDFEEKGVEVDEEEAGRGSVVIGAVVMVVGVGRGPEAVGDVAIDMIGLPAMWLEGSLSRRLCLKEVDGWEVEGLMTPFSGNQGPLILEKGSRDGIRSRRGTSKQPANPPHKHNCGSIRV